MSRYATLIDIFVQLTWFYDTTLTGHDFIVSLATQIFKEYCTACVHGMLNTMLSTAYQDMASSRVILHEARPQAVQAIT